MVARSQSNKPIGQAIRNQILPMVEFWRLWGFAPEFIEYIGEIHRALYSEHDRNLQAEAVSRSRELGLGRFVDKIVLVTRWQKASNHRYEYHFTEVSSPFASPFEQFNVPPCWPRTELHIGGLVTIYNKLGFFETEVHDKLRLWAAKRYAAQCLASQFAQSVNNILSGATRQEEIMALWPELFYYMDGELRRKKEKRPRLKLKYDNVPASLLTREFRLSCQTLLSDEIVKSFRPDEHIEEYAAPKTLEHLSSILPQAALFYNPEKRATPLYKLSINTTVSRLTI